MSKINNCVYFKIKLLSGIRGVLVEAEGYETEIFIPAINNNRIQLVNVISSEKLSIITPLKRAENRLNAINRNNSANRKSSNIVINESVENNGLAATNLLNKNKEKSKSHYCENVTRTQPMANSTPEIGSSKSNSDCHWKSKKTQSGTGYSTGYFTGPNTVTSTMENSCSLSMNNTSNYANLSCNYISRADSSLFPTPEIVRRAISFKKTFETSVPQLGHTYVAKERLQNFVVENNHQLSFSPIQPQSIDKEYISDDITQNIDNSTIHLPATPTFVNEDSRNSQNSTGGDSFLNMSPISAISQWPKCITPERTYLRHGKFQMLTPKLESTPRLRNGALIPDFLRNPTKGLGVQNPINLDWLKPKLLIDDKLTITDTELENQIDSTGDVQRSDFYFPRTKVELKRKRFSSFDPITIPQHNHCIAKKLKKQFLKGCRKRTTTTNPKFKSLIKDVSTPMRIIIPTKLQPKYLVF